MKTILQKHLLTILCAVSLLALLLPFATVTSDVSVMGYSAGNSNTVSGLSAVTEGTLGFVLALGPALLIAMNYIKPLEKYKGMLALIVPVLCAVVSVLVFLQCKSICSVGAGNEYYSVEVSQGVGLGFLLALASYVGTFFAGAMVYHGFTFNKKGVETLKTAGKDMTDKLGQAAQSVKKSASDRGGRGKGEP